MFLRVDFPAPYSAPESDYNIEMVGLEDISLFPYPQEIDPYTSQWYYDFNYLFKSKGVCYFSLFKSKFLNVGNYFSFPEDSGNSGKPFATLDNIYPTQLVIYAFDGKNVYRKFYGPNLFSLRSGITEIYSAYWVFTDQNVMQNGHWLG